MKTIFIFAENEDALPAVAEAENLDIVEGSQCTLAEGVASCAQDKLRQGRFGAISWGSSLAMAQAHKRRGQ